MKTQLNTEPILVQDTREPQKGSWGEYFQEPPLIATLPTGDFSICGCENLIAIERKTLPDLIACLSHERDRFEAELKRAARIATFYVIFEGRYSEVAKGKYRSNMTPKSAWESLMAFQERYKIPFLAGENVFVAASMAESILFRWYREHAKAIEQAMKGRAKATDSIESRYPPMPF